MRHASREAPPWAASTSRAACLGPPAAPGGPPRAGPEATISLQGRLQAKGTGDVGGPRACAQHGHHARSAVDQNKGQGARQRDPSVASVDGHEASASVAQRRARSHLEPQSVEERGESELVRVREHLGLAVRRRPARSKHHAMAGAAVDLIRRLAARVCWGGHDSDEKGSGHGDSESSTKHGAP